MTAPGVFSRPFHAAAILVTLALGVSMITGTLAFVDTLDHALGDIFHSAVGGADVLITGRGEDVLGNVRTPPVPGEVLTRVTHLGSVAHAEGQILDRASLLTLNRQPFSRNGAPTLAVSLLHRPFDGVRVTRGRAPRGGGEVALDLDTARAAHVSVGQIVSIASEVPVRRFRVVGLVAVGDSSLGASTLLVFDLSTAQALSLRRGMQDSILVKGRRGVSPRRLAQQIAPLLAPGLEVRTADQATRQRTDSILGQLGALTSALIAVGVIGATVAALGMLSILSLSFTARRRELAILRILGATRGQLVLRTGVEALVLGAVACLLGTGLGYLGVDAIRSGLTEAGVGLPASATVLATRAVVIGTGAGLMLALVGSLGALLGATRPSAVAALREPDTRETAHVSRLRLVVGGALAITAGGLAARGVTGGDVTSAAAGGALALLGVAAVMPRLAPLATAIVGGPLRRGGPAGRLAQRNAGRNPRRTAGVSTSTMVGVALVLVLALLADGARVSARRAIEQSFQGDLAITHRDGTSSISPAAAGLAASIPGVQNASIVRATESTVAGAGAQTAHGVDLLTLPSAYRFRWIAGSDENLGLLGPDGALVEKRLADHLGLDLGSRLTVRTRAGLRTSFLVRGVYRDPGLLAGFTLGMPSFLDTFHQSAASEILVKLLPEVDRVQTEQNINRALTAYPNLRARSQSQLATEQVARLDPAFYALEILVGLSVLVTGLIAANALSLSVLQQTRELGLLRALGMTQGQVRRMVGGESVIATVTGAALGLAMGVGVTEVVAGSLPDGAIALSIPWLTLLLLLAGAILVGLLAIILPARRATRVDILAALSYE